MKLYSSNNTKILLRKFWNVMSVTKYFHADCIDPPVKYVLIDDKEVTRKIAYKKYEGHQDVGVIYVPGFMSNMCGSKATALNGFCQKNGLPYLRYDATGLGESHSTPISKARLTHWIQDAEKMLSLVSMPQIVVGSSMGGWISLLMCLKYPEKFHSLVLLAPGVNFTKRYFDSFMKTLPKSILKQLENGESVTFNHPKYGPFPISFDLTNDMYQHEIDFSKGLDIHCPVRIIHGMLDEDVDYKESLDLINALNTTDIHLTLIKDGEHTLSSQQNLNLIFDTILRLL